MNPVPIPPILLAVTLLIFMHDDQRVGTATGMFYQHGNSYFLVTAKHILEGMNGACPQADAIKLVVHRKGEDLRGGSDLVLHLYGKGRTRLYKTKENVDLALVPIPKEEASKLNQTWIDEENFLPPDSVLMPGEAVMALGYPGGSGDAVYCLPFAFTGGIASAFGLKFQDKEPVCYANMDLQQGMSGAPVFTTFKKIDVFKGQKIVSLNPNHYLLGIHAATVSSLDKSRRFPLASIVYAGEIKMIASE